MTTTRRRPQLRIVRRNPPPPDWPTRRPLDCVIIAVDVALNAGTATYVAGRLEHYSEVTTREPAQRLSVLHAAIRVAASRRLQVGLALEVSYGGHQSAALSLSGSATLWRDSWHMLEQPLAHVIERTAGDWRRALFGRAKMPRAQSRKLEATYAKSVVTRDLGHALASCIGADAAAAICFGERCTRSQALKALLQCPSIY